MTQVSAAAWALVLDSCRGDIELARCYVLSEHPLCSDAPDGEIEITGPSVESDVASELWNRLPYFFGGDDSAAAAFLLRPLPHFEYRSLGLLANESPTVWKWRSITLARSKLASTSRPLSLDRRTRFDWRKAA